MLTLLLGGARSGKSSLAVSLAASEASPVTFIATAEGRDDELAERIARHRAERPAGWTTVEEPLGLQDALGAVAPRDVAVIDCLTLWVSNLLERGARSEEVAERAVAVAALARDRAGLVVVVSNEVGSGIVPADVLSRRYRDALGTVNAAFAAAASHAYLVVAGRTVVLDVPPGASRGALR